MRSLLFQPRIYLHQIKRGLGLLLLLLTADVGLGAVVHLRDGDRLTGVIQSVGSDGIVITTRWQESLKIPMGEIEKLEGGGVELPRKPEPAAAGVKAGGGGKRAAVAAVAPVKPKAPKLWKGSLRLGMDLLFSEKNRQLYTGRLKLGYVQEHFRTSLDYLASYGRTDGDVSVNRMDATSKTDFDLPENWYVYNLAQAGYDQIRRVDSRYELGPGIGYRLVRRKALTVDVEAGGNYKRESRSDGTDTEQFVARFSEALQWRVTPRMSLEEQFEFLPEIGDWGEYRFRFETSMDYQLLGNVSLNLTVINQYDTRPAKSVQQNDLQVRSSVGLTF